MCWWNNLEVGTWACGTVGILNERPEHALVQQSAICKWKARIVIYK
jgi:hypothetical protein